MLCDRGRAVVAGGIGETLGTEALFYCSGGTCRPSTFAIGTPILTSIGSRLEIIAKNAARNTRPCRIFLVECYSLPKWQKKQENQKLDMCDWLHCRLITIYVLRRYLEDGSENGNARRCVFTALILTVPQPVRPKTTKRTPSYVYNNFLIITLIN